MLVMQLAQAAQLLDGGRQVCYLNLVAKLDRRRG